MSSRFSHIEIACSDASQIKLASLKLASSPLRASQMMYGRSGWRGVGMVYKSSTLMVDDLSTALFWCQAALIRFYQMAAGGSTDFIDENVRFDRNKKIMEHFRASRIAPAHSPLPFSQNMLPDEEIVRRLRVIRLSNRRERYARRLPSMTAIITASGLSRRQVYNVVNGIPFGDQCREALSRALITCADAKRARSQSAAFH